MRISDIRALEKCCKVCEAHKRLEQDDIKGLTVAVIFEGGGRGPQNDVPVQMFVPYDSDAYSSIMPVVQAKVSETKAEAEAQLAVLKEKLAAELADAS